ncbi:hypothetical protein CGU43_21555 [Pseudomonas aeruginosa]|nr:hypothetical protein CGU43_21555 [Pseudomonas aeruginosa]RUG90538.1 hypothetical protein IPC751_16680 [Pseudomonas aeruginosa]
MLFAPALADRAILPTAWGGRYFFNRIGQKRPLVIYELRAHSVAVARKSVLVIRKSRRRQLRNSQSQRRTSAL